MSFFDSVDEIKYQIGRFLWPTIFMVVGILFCYIALVPEQLTLNNGEILHNRQSPFFLYGAIFFMLGSVIWYLYLFGIIRTMAGWVVLGIMCIFSAYLLYLDYAIIDEDVKYKARYEMIDKDIIARMFDIKAAEGAYKDFYKHYTNNLDTLIWFVKNGKKMTVPNIGQLPDRAITPEERDYIYGDNRPIDKLMTDQEANCLAHSPNPPADLIGFSRDTVYVDVLDAIFLDEKYQTNRDKLGASLPFHPDSLKFVPHTSNLVILDTASVQKGEIRVPTIMFRMTHPMDSARVYQIGDLKDNHLRESWSK